MKTLLPYIFTLATITYGDTPSSVPPDTDEAAYPAIERFISVLESVRKNHPDADKLAYDRLVNRALEGMLSSLDPHSSFIHPEMRKAMESNEELDTHVASLGITISLRDAGFTITHLTRFGPADLQNIRTGTSILEIDGQNPSKSPIGKVLASLHKPAGSQTTLLLQTSLQPKPIAIVLTHLKVSDRAITQQHLLPEHNNIGYIRLTQFTAPCDKEVEDALDALEAQGMKSLILDLRGNPGGRLDATVRMLGLFLPPASEVVSIRSRNKPPEILKTPETQRRKRDYPICVLMDRLSASAAELTAAALQDLRRATIIGETSYGKGSVQNIIPMSGHTALRLTFATYHSPSGKTPHHVGVIPDLAVTFTDTDRQNFLLQLQSDSLTPEQQSTLKSWQDPAIQTAIDTLHKNP